MLTLWLGISGWLLAATPPPARGTWLGAAALLWVSLLIVGIAFWSGWARPWFRRWSGAAVSTGAILVVVTSRVVWFAFGGWVEVVAVVLTVPLVLGVALIAFWRLRRRRGWALSALIASASFALLLGAGVPQAVPSLRWRINTFGTGNWAARSEDLLDRAPPRSSLIIGQPTVVERGGASAVAWPVIHGLPASTYGLLYDPGHVADASPTKADLRSDIAMRLSTCERLDDRWRWCRLY